MFPSEQSRQSNLQGYFTGAGNVAQDHEGANRSSRLYGSGLVHSSWRGASDFICHNDILQLAIWSRQRIYAYLLQMRGRPQRNQVLLICPNSPMDSSISLIEIPSLKEPLATVFSHRCRNEGLRSLVYHFHSPHFPATFILVILNSTKSIDPNVLQAKLARYFDQIPESLGQC
ncbi:hypothetical protein MGG_16297 [Pyricularia oryzae 70-15]|uniref:Uncharacterized protein n=3 Tax=Pyricularia oryzae TaxID=318829 RepID=G4MRJ9_PYRO7|nr:uncharacterized protein MGG_16297 [Pyricularia oryzae 70-15]EHA57422.1 hypothetical protein MGG_16297 [Pyricularia oryzae 70-15]ELQ43139.1 hypothetical protein OOU_Y34scaffold00172g9 [Pyricularia oryzae Y34]KAI7928590.1 hypothetical protein M9X92_001678 [Pyricularia oryzae]KAI7928740.1 hypothetical protein M0657_002564 [Pyricularia oryzae]